MSDDAARKKRLSTVTAWLVGELKLLKRGCRPTIHEVDTQ
jgi:hypothetical protein